MNVCFRCNRVFPMALDGDKCPWCGLEHRTYEPDVKVSSGQSEQKVRQAPVPFSPQFF